MKIHVCTCKQCRAQKAKRKNRTFKKKIKRLLNKRRRQMTDESRPINFYWS